MNTLFKRLLTVVAVLMLISLPAYAQYTTFVVDAGGAPLTYPTLASAIATANSWPMGPHKIMVKAGTYNDADLVPINVDEIYGDPGAALGDIKFVSPAGTHNFLTAAANLQLKNMELDGYAGKALIIAAAGVSVQDVIIHGASGTGIDLSGSTGATVDGVSFIKLTKGIIGNAFTGATVQNCQFDTCTYAVDVTGGYGGVYDNIGIQNGSYGFYFRTGSDGNEVKNTTIANMVQMGATLIDADGNYIHDNLIYQCVSYAVSLDATSGTPSPNWVRYNCFVNNRAAGPSQGFDANATTANSWLQNYYSDQVFTMAGGGLGATDGNPKTYMVAAVAGASSYNLNDEFVVDFNYDMPGCAELDSVLTAAYQFTAYFDQTKLELVDQGYYKETGLLGPDDPALYTGIDASTPGAIVYAAANFTTPGVNGAPLAWAKFKVIAANTSTTISEVANYFRDPGNNSMPVGAAPVSLTLVDNVPPVLVDYSANEPAGDNGYSDGSTAGPGPFFKLFLTMHATDDYALAKFQWNSDGGAWNDWIPATAVDFTSAATQFDFVWLGLGEGTHTAGMRVVDAGGNTSNELFYTYVIDRTAPALTSFVVSDKDGCALDPARWTNAQLVAAAITATGDPDSMMVSESGDQPKQAFAAAFDFTLGAAEVAHTVYVRLYDKYNNRLDWTAANAITLDMTAPVAVGPLLINGGAAKTNNPAVSLTLTAWGLGGLNRGEWNATETEANLACGDGGWKPADVAPPHAFTLSGPPDGNKTVYFATRDSAGNISNHLSATIELDTKGPDLSSFSVAALTGKACANAWSPAYMAHYDWSETDVVELEYSWDGTTWGNWKNLTGVTAPDSTQGGFSTPGDGVKRIYARLKDDIGNTGPSMYADLEVDMTAPTIGTEVCADKGNSYTPDPTYPTGVTNSADFLIKLTGLSADITDIEVSEDNGTTWSSVGDAGGAAAYDIDYTWSTTPTECSWIPVQVRVSDCAGNQTVSSANVYFDIAGPSITSFTGPVTSNALAVPLVIVATDNCAGTAYEMRLKDGAAPDGAWVAFNASPTFTLDPGDGDHTIYLEIADYGGNVASATVLVKLDMTPPTAGTFQIISGNPLAVPGYTNSLSGNSGLVTRDGDVVSIWVQNTVAPFNPTNWIPVASPLPLNQLTPAGAGVKTINYWFMDGSGNQGGPFTATVNYSPSAPAAPGGFTSTPGGSCLLQWNAVADAQRYIVRFNFQNQYPTYQDPNPPFPANMTEGILATDTATGTQFKFEGPQPDIYAFSLWTLNKYGVLSSAHSTAMGTNYILGDFDPTPDGCIKFGDEFGALAIAYNSILGDPNFNQYLDIAPTNDASAHGYPMPDQAVDFEDLVIFALNYDNHHALPSGDCPSPTASNEQEDVAATKPVATALDVTAIVPTRLRTGDECVVPITITDYESVKGYHVILDYDHASFDLVRVEQGTGYESVAESFFYVNPKTSKIDVSGVVLGKDVTFTNDELFRIVLKAKYPTDAAVTSEELTFRDRENRDLAASLSLSRTVTLPTEFDLAQNYPNPFNPTTTIEFALPTASNYTLTIYNVLGQVVKTFEGRSDAGYLKVDWDASAQSSGVYLYRLEAGSFEATRKMVLLK